MTDTIDVRRRRGVSLRPTLVAALGPSLLLLGPAALGHGYMTYPVPRAVEHVPGDPKGWPIAGVKATLRREPCVGLAQNTRHTSVRPGPLELEFLFPDGANHVGSCAVFLFDPLAPDHRVRIGESPDCARSLHPGPGMKGENIPGRMSVQIPEALPCDPSHCVLHWVWTATHRSATNPERFEHYDNCADIEVVGGRRGTDEPAAPLASAVPSAPASPLAPATPPAPTTAPSAVTAAPPPNLAAASAETSAPLPPSIAIGQGHLQHLLAIAAVDGGAGGEMALDALQRRLEGLELDRRIDPAAHARAEAENRRGKRQLRDGDVSDALHSFDTAYRLAPVDAEIVNNFGYAYLLDDNPEAAEPLFLQALLLEPRRTNAWANLGQSYALRGKREEASASFALAYRYSSDRAVTRRFLQRLAADEHEETALAAASTLRLPPLRERSR